MDRAPSVVQRQAVVLGILRIANIRRAGTAVPLAHAIHAAAGTPLPTPLVEPPAPPEPELVGGSGCMDPEEEELEDAWIDELNRREAERRRIEEEEEQFRLERFEEEAEEADPCSHQVGTEPPEDQAAA